LNYLDPFRHHVYSFSPAKRFELKLVVRDQSRKVAFDRPGVVAIGCNIKNADDSLGHHAGDRLLNAVAARQRSLPFAVFS
jgi:predicted signal transduction protein with EAL and GGDEF domain